MFLIWVGFWDFLIMEGYDTHRGDLGQRIRFWIYCSFFVVFARMSSPRMRSLIRLGLVFVSLGEFLVCI